jgi:hypothetical protein
MTNYQYIRLIIGKTGLVIAPLLILLYACLGVMIWQNF